MLMLEKPMSSLFVLFNLEFWLKEFQQTGLQFTRRNNMTTPVSAGLMLAKVPQQSTPYFSVSQQQIEEGRSRKRFLAGHDVEKQRFCEHYSPMIGFVRGRFGPPTISMNFSCCYKEADLENWTKAAKCKILDVVRSEGAKGPVESACWQLFEEGNLVMSWLDSNCLDSIHKFVPKVNILFVFCPKDDYSFAYERWARERNVFLVHLDLQLDDEKENLIGQQGWMRHAFNAVCTDTINTLNTFLKYETCCSVCKEKRTIHAAFACDGTSKSIGVLLANIMFFGHCDADTALLHLLNKPRIWKPLPLVDHTYVLEALFHQEQCIRVAIGK